MELQTDLVKKKSEININDLKNTPNQKVENSSKELIKTEDK
ncbi:hypothetical protein RUS48_04070 [Mycoplasmoides gallisepticum]|nr:hypothetical protein RUS48_03980 [Mycoplasmoides gallisepticum]WVH34401.1 hypothetical protein RUS48_04070 [Mycoplasmoides gallisepticum]